MVTLYYIFCTKKIFFVMCIFSGNWLLFDKERSAADCTADYYFELSFCV